MKEDAQLTCPVSFEDPNNLWNELQDAINEELPLRDVTWKSPMSSTFITISTLPLRFLSSTANLFKETDHAYRWFLAPYVQLYLLGAESLESYRAVKPAVKKWVDQKSSQNGVLGKVPWFIVYVPLGGYGMDIYSKVYSRISSDFYSERYGDRSVMLPVLSSISNKSSINNQHISANNSMFGELFSLLRDGVVQSFQHRYSLYNVEIRKLDATRGTPTFDFKQLFLVKESLALMLQMLQLLDHALKQYEELEAILSYANITSLPSNDWPMIAPEQLKTGEASEQQPLNIPTKEREKDAMSDAIKNGEEIVAYSINLARMKILKNKLSALELHRYVFARQIFFLIALQRAPVCALKARTFLLFSCTAIEKRIIQETVEDSPAVANSNKSSKMQVLTSLRAKQAEVWALTAAIKLVRVCKDLISKILETDNGVNLKDRMGPSVTRQSLLACIVAYKKSSGMSFFVDEGDNYYTEGSTAVPIGLDEKIDTVRDTFRTLAEILEFAMRRFRKLTPVLHLSRRVTLQINESIMRDKNATSEIKQNMTLEGDATPILQQGMSSDQYFEVFHQESRNTLTSTMRMELEALHIEKKDTLDNVLVSVAQRIRSASHFWAKLYSCPPNPKKFGHIVENYSYASLASNLTTSHFQRGRSLELSLSILLNEALWELYLVCERYRFACSSKLQVASLLMCCDQNALCCQILDSLLFNAERLHSDSEIRYINAKLSPHNIMHWTDLRLWALTVYITTTLKLGSASRYQAGLAQLVITKQTTPTYNFKDDSDNSSSEDCSHVVEEIIRCARSSDGSSASTLTSLVHSAALQGGLRHLFRVTDKPLVAVHPIVIPLTALVRVSFDRYDSKQDSAKLLRGFETIHDDSYPTHVIQFSSHEPLQQIMRVNWPYSCTTPLAKVSVVYRKIQNHIFDRTKALITAKSRRSSFVLHDLEEANSKKPFRSNSATDELPAPIDMATPRQFSKQASTGLDKYFEAADDEFLCKISQLHDSNETMEFELCPGENSFNLQVVPNALGEFGIERIVFSIGNLIFLDKPMFREHTDIDAARSSAFPALSLVGSDYQFPRNSNNIEEFETMPLSHGEVQHYLNNFPLVKVAEPTRVLQANVFVAELIPPPPAADFCVISLTTMSDEIVEHVSVAIESSKESRFISRKKGLDASYQQYSLDFSAAGSENFSIHSKKVDVPQLDGTTSASTASNKVMFSPGNIAAVSNAEINVPSLSFPSSQLLALEAIQDSWAINGGEDFLKICPPSDWELSVLNIDAALQEELTWTRVSEVLSGKLLACGSEDLVLSIISSERSGPTVDSSQLKVSHLPADKRLLLKIPFTVSWNRDLDDTDQQIVVSQCKISFQGELVRNHCKMPFSMGFTQQVACGHLLYGRAVRAVYVNRAPTLMHVLQVKYFNVGPQPITLVGYSLLRFRSITDADEFFADDDVNHTTHFTTSHHQVDWKKQPTDIPFIDCSEVDPLQANKLHQKSHMVLLPEEEYSMTLMCTFLDDATDMNPTSLQPLVVRLWFKSLTPQSQSDSLDPFHAVYFLDKVAVDVSTTNIINKNIDILTSITDEQFSITNSDLIPRQFNAVLNELSIISGVIIRKNGGQTESLAYHIESIETIDNPSFDTSDWMLAASIKLNEDLDLQCSSMRTSHWLIVGIKVAPLDIATNADFLCRINIIAIPITIGTVNIPGLKVTINRDDRTTYKQLFPQYGASTTVVRVLPQKCIPEEVVDENSLSFEEQNSWFQLYDDRAI